jgi:glycosyltransferase involved in cell wall biosynthesis
VHLLLIHNYYREPGGEDDVLESEKALLSSRGHTITEYVRHNQEIAGYSALSKALIPAKITWAWDSYGGLRELLRKAKPDVAHFHNTFPLISPAAYYACRDAGVPVVQMLHNSRLLCPVGTFFRDGRVCEDCLGKRITWPGIVHGCYHGSSLQTSGLSGMLAVHKAVGTWEHLVDAYVVFTEFHRRKFVEGGLPANKVVVKPHFLMSDPGVRSGDGDYALFVGRLVPEKGVHVLAEAWRGLKVPLKIRGDGPMLAEVEALARENPFVEVVRRPSREEYFALVRGARFLVWPSVYNEAFGRVVIDAFASGVPVLASRLPVCTELVSERAGLHFNSGDAKDLAAMAQSAWDNPTEMRKRGSAARKEYEEKYGANRNYDLLLNIYERVLKNNQQVRGLAMGQA